MKRFIVCCLVAAAASACNEGKVLESESLTDGGTAGITQSTSLAITFGPVAVPPGEERTQCALKRLGNAGKVHIGSIHNRLSRGSHHLIIYRVSDTEERPTPYDCRPFADTLKPEKGAPLMITQKADDLLTLPEGIGYELGENQMIRLEMHYINAGAEELTVSATSTMMPLAEGALKHEADVLLIGNLNINVPPKSKVTLGPKHMKLPSVYDGANFFAITGHEHQFGTNVRVSLSPAEGAPGTPVYDVPDWTWSEPKTVFADPPFTVPPGGGFNLTCDWENTSDRTLTFGESAEQEMCFFWGYYYPRKAGPRVIIAF